ncbi:heme/hemin ABC transporter substrate-binding protein [Kiloniella antarctica]|uniref:Hemin ABC transporter substrate-binding protein n=1 Tax=Kiloniella antarctica TaxID=1550907 RepID=A0ABW5BQ29_9PROT
MLNLFYKIIVRFFACTLLFSISSPSFGDDISPKKIITIGGPVTEIVFALGEGAKVIATDTTSKFPQQTFTLPKVGYMRQLSVEGLLSLGPDHIIALEGSGPTHVLEAIKNTGVQVTLIPELVNPERIEQGINLISILFNPSSSNSKLGTEVKEQLEEQLKSAETRTVRPSVLFLLNTGHGNLMTAGKDTAIDTIIRYTGAINSAADLKGFKPLSTEYMISHSPDYVLLSQRTLDQAGGISQLQSDPVLGQLNAVKESRILTIDGTLLLGLGPRTPKAIQELTAELLKPAL